MRSGPRSGPACPRSISESTGSGRRGRVRSWRGEGPFERVGRSAAPTSRPSTSRAFWSRSGGEPTLRPSPPDNRSLPSPAPGRFVTELKKTLGGVQLFSMGFGSIVGVGWIVLMGFWFRQAGPGGTAVAFLLGGLLLALVGLCYAEMSTMLPVAGGEASFAFASFGTPVGFVVGWAMTLMMIAVLPYV